MRILVQDFIHIITDTPSERLSYSCRVVFECVLKMPYLLHTGSSIASEGAVCILYSPFPPHYKKDVFWIKSAGLLQQKTIEEQKLTITQVDGVPVIFGQSGEGPAMPFDVMSAVFYMASRYEEYLPYRTDQWGRFQEKESLTHRMGWTQKAIVHYWCALLLSRLQQHYPHFSPPIKAAEALFTYDFDVAYAYKGRSLATHLLSLGKDVVQGNLHNLRAKWKYRFGLCSDPWDSYALIEEAQVPQRFFFLAAARRGPHDRNIDRENPLLQALVKRMANKGFVGVHPSFSTTEKPQLIEDEKSCLEKMTGRSILHSRQHYLRFRLPQLARHLIAAGILHDYSMQYPEIPGFRAGLCVSYPFFDLEKNEKTALTLHPGCIMDTTFRDDLHLTPEESLAWYMQCSAEVQRWGGTFISIWHNDMLGTPIWPQYPHSFAGVHATMVQHWQTT